MNSEEKFKKSLEDLLQSKEFPFDEANWEKAREIIDASKKGKRKATPLVLAGLLLLLTALVSVYTLFKSPVSAEKLAVNTKVNSNEKFVQTESKKPEAVSEKAEKQINTSKKTRTDAPQASTETEITASKLKTTTSFPSPASVKETNELVKSGPSKNTTVPLPPTVMINGEEKQYSNPQAENRVSNKGKITVTLNRVPTDSQLINDSPLETAVITGASKNPDKELSNNSKLAEPNNSPESLNPVVAPPVEAKTEALAETSRETNVPADTTLPSIAIVDTIKSSSQVSADVLPGDNSEGEIGKPTMETVVFSIEAGASYLYGWQNGNSKDAEGFNPLIGINYFKNYNSRISASAGLHYSSVSRLSYSSYTSKVTRLSFGEESTVNLYTPHKIHYLIMPLRFNCQLNPKNTVGMAANISYLLNVEGEMETYTEKLNQPYNSVITKTTGYGEGFQKYDVQLAVFYKRKIYSHLAINLEAFYGLTDVKNNTFFKSNVFERNTGLKLTLVYNFLKK